MTNPTHICATCLSECKPKTKARGSIWIEIILWLLWILPGLIYSIWRLSTKYKACPVCGSTDLVPLNTYRGRELQKQRV